LEAALAGARRSSMSFSGASTSRTASRQNRLRPPSCARGANVRARRRIRSSTCQRSNRPTSCADQLNLREPRNGGLRLRKTRWETNCRRDRCVCRVLTDSVVLP
jgi:hypothetical protein